MKNNLKQTRVCVVGLGYIGLPTAALIANSGYKVCGVDIDKNAVETINKGEIHIVEPGLKKFVKSAVQASALSAFEEPQESDIYIICVPTPFYPDNEIPTPNLEFVLKAADSISNYLKEGDIVILESTSPVGATNILEKHLRSRGVDTQSIFLAYCPERVLPGNIMKELVENDRVIGGINDESTKMVVDFYKTFIKGNIFETSSKTAEMCKLTENSFRDINIAFANELSVICDEHEIDVWALIQLANRHPRVNILQPGAGVGGHCIAVDPWFLVSSNPESAKLIKKAREVNDSKPKWVVDKIIQTAHDKRKTINKDAKLTIACLGLSFKPDIDDLRESPAVEIVKNLENQDFNLIVVEPNIKDHQSLNLVSLDEALNEADIIAILVKHSEFLSDESIKKLKKPFVLDFCGAFS